GQSYTSISKVVDGYVETAVIRGMEVEIGGASVTSQYGKNVSVTPNDDGGWDIHSKTTTTFTVTYYENNYNQYGIFVDGYSYSHSETMNGRASYSNFRGNNPSLSENQNSSCGFTSPIKDVDGNPLSFSQYLSVMENLADLSEESIEQMVKDLLETGVLQINGMTFNLDVPEGDDMISRSFSIQKFENIAGEKKLTSSTDFGVNYSSEQVVKDGNLDVTDPNNRYQKKNISVSISRTTHRYSSGGLKISQKTNGWSAGLHVQNEGDLTHPVTNEVLSESGIGTNLLGSSYSSYTINYRYVAGDWVAGRKTETTYYYGSNDNENTDGTLVIDQTVSVTTNTIIYQYDRDKGYLIGATGRTETKTYDLDMEKYVGEDGKYPPNFTDAEGNVLTDRNGNWIANSTFEGQQAVLTSYGTGETQYIIIKGNLEVLESTTVTRRMQPVLINEDSVSQHSDRITIETTHEKNYYNIFGELSANRKISRSKDMLPDGSSEIPDGFPGSGQGVDRPYRPGGGHGGYDRPRRPRMVRIDGEWVRVDDDRTILEVSDDNESTSIRPRETDIPERSDDKGHTPSRRASKPVKTPEKAARRTSSDIRPTRVGAKRKPGQPKMDAERKDLSDLEVQKVGNTPQKPINEYDEIKDKKKFDAVKYEGEIPVLTDEDEEEPIRSYLPPVILDPGKFRKDFKDRILGEKDPAIRPPRFRDRRITPISSFDERKWGDIISLPFSPLPPKIGFPKPIFLPIRDDIKPVEETPIKVKPSKPIKDISVRPMKEPVISPVSTKPVKPIKDGIKIKDMSDVSLIKPELEGIPVLFNPDKINELLPDDQFDILENIDVPTISFPIRSKFKPGEKFSYKPSKDCEGLIFYEHPVLAPAMPISFTGPVEFEEKPIKFMPNRKLHFDPLKPTIFAEGTDRYEPNKPYYLDSITPLPNEKFIFKRNCLVPFKPGKPIYPDIKVELPFAPDRIVPVDVKPIYFDPNSPRPNFVELTPYSPDMFGGRRVLYPQFGQQFGGNVTTQSGDEISGGTQLQAAGFYGDPMPKETITNSEYRGLVGYGNYYVLSESTSMTWSEASWDVLTNQKTMKMKYTLNDSINYNWLDNLVFTEQGYNQQSQQYGSPYGGYRQDDRDDQGYYTLPDGRVIPRITDVREEYIEEVGSRAVSDYGLQQLELEVPQKTSYASRAVSDFGVQQATGPELRQSGRRLVSDQGISDDPGPEIFERPTRYVRRGGRRSGHGGQQGTQPGGRQTRGHWSSDMSVTINHSRTDYEYNKKGVLIGANSMSVSHTTALRMINGRGGSQRGTTGQVEQSMWAGDDRHDLFDRFDLEMPGRRLPLQQYNSGALIQPNQQMRQQVFAFDEQGELIEMDIDINISGGPRPIGYVRPGQFTGGSQTGTQTTSTQLPASGLTRVDISRNVTQTKQVVINGQLKNSLVTTQSISYDYPDSYSSEGGARNQKVNTTFSSTTTKYAYKENGQLDAENSSKSGVSYTYSSFNGHDYIPTSLNDAVANAQPYSDFYLDGYSMDTYTLEAVNGQLLDAEKTSIRVTLPNTYNYTTADPGAFSGQSTGGGGGSGYYPGSGSDDDYTTTTINIDDLEPIDNELYDNYSMRSSSQQQAPVIEISDDGDLLQRHGIQVTLTTDIREINLDDYGTTTGGGYSGGGYTTTQQTSHSGGSNVHGAYNNFLNGSTRAQYVAEHNSENGFLVIPDETVTISVTVTKNEYDKYGRLTGVEENSMSFSFEDKDMDGKFSQGDLQDGVSINFPDPSLMRSDPAEYFSQLGLATAEGVWNKASDNNNSLEPMEFSFSITTKEYKIINGEAKMISSETQSWNVANTGGYTTEDDGSNATLDYSLVNLTCTVTTATYDYDDNGRLRGATQQSYTAEFEFDTERNQNFGNFTNRWNITPQQIQNCVSIRGDTVTAVGGAYRASYTRSTMKIINGQALEVSSKTCSSADPDEEESKPSVSITNKQYDQYGRLTGASGTSTSDGKTTQQDYIIINGEMKLSKSTPEEGDPTTYTYDDRGHLVGAQSPGAEFVIINGQAYMTYKYDSGSNSSSSTSTSTYTYWEEENGEMVEKEGEAVTTSTTNSSWWSETIQSFDFYGRQKSKETSSGSSSYSTSETDYGDGVATGNTITDEDNDGIYDTLNTSEGSVSIDLDADGEVSGFTYNDETYTMNEDGQFMNENNEVVSGSISDITGISEADIETATWIAEKEPPVPPQRVYDEDGAFVGYELPDGTIITGVSDTDGDGDIDQITYIPPESDSPKSGLVGDLNFTGIMLIEDGDYEGALERFGLSEGMLLGMQQGFLNRDGDIPEGPLMDIQSSTTESWSTSGSHTIYKLTKGKLSEGIKNEWQDSGSTGSKTVIKQFDLITGQWKTTTITRQGTEEDMISTSVTTTTGLVITGFDDSGSPITEAVEYISNISITHTWIEESAAKDTIHTETISTSYSLNQTGIGEWEVVGLQTVFEERIEVEIKGPNGVAVSKELIYRNKVSYLGDFMVDSIGTHDEFIAAWDAAENEYLANEANINNPDEYISGFKTQFGTFGVEGMEDTYFVVYSGPIIKDDPDVEYTSGSAPESDEEDKPDVTFVILQEIDLMMVLGQVDFEEMLDAILGDSGMSFSDLNPDQQMEFLNQISDLLNQVGDIVEDIQITLTGEDGSDIVINIDPDATFLTFSTEGFDGISTFNQLRTFFQGLAGEGVEAGTVFLALVAGTGLSVTNLVLTDADGNELILSKEENPELYAQVINQIMTTLFLGENLDNFSLNHGGAEYTISSIGMSILTENGSIGFSMNLTNLINNSDFNSLFSDGFGLTLLLKIAMGDLKFATSRQFSDEGFYETHTTTTTDYLYNDNGDLLFARSDTDIKRYDSEGNSTQISVPGQYFTFYTGRQGNMVAYYSQQATISTSTNTTYSINADGKLTYETTVNTTFHLAIQIRLTDSEGNVIGMIDTSLSVTVEGDHSNYLDPANNGADFMEMMNSYQNEGLIGEDGSSLGLADLTAMQLEMLATTGSISIDGVTYTMNNQNLTGVISINYSRHERYIINGNVVDKAQFDVSLSFNEAGFLQTDEEGNELRVDITNQFVELLTAFIRNPSEENKQAVIDALKELGAAILDDDGNVVDLAEMDLDEVREELIKLRIGHWLGANRYQLAKYEYLQVASLSVKTTSYRYGSDGAMISQSASSKAITTAIVGKDSSIHFGHVAGTNPSAADSIKELGEGDVFIVSVSESTLLMTPNGLVLKNTTVTKNYGMGGSQKVTTADAASGEASVEIEGSENVYVADQGYTETHEVTEYTYDKDGNLIAATGYSDRYVFAENDQNFYLYDEETGEMLEFDPNLHTNIVDGYYVDDNGKKWAIGTISDLAREGEQSFYKLGELMKVSWTHTINTYEIINGMAQIVRSESNTLSQGSLSRTIADMTVYDSNGNVVEDITPTDDEINQLLENGYFVRNGQEYRVEITLANGEVIQLGQQTSDVWNNEVIQQLLSGGDFSVSSMIELMVQGAYTVDEFIKFLQFAYTNDEINTFLANLAESSTPLEDLIDFVEQGFEAQNEDDDKIFTMDHILQFLSHDLLPEEVEEPEESPFDVQNAFTSIFEMTETEFENKINEIKNNEEPIDLSEYTLPEGESPQIVDIQFDGEQIVEITIAFNNSEGETEFLKIDTSLISSLSTSEILANIQNLLGDMEGPLGEQEGIAMDENGIYYLKAEEESPKDELDSLPAPRRAGRRLRADEPIVIPDGVMEIIQQFLSTTPGQITAQQLNISQQEFEALVEAILNGEESFELEDGRTLKDFVFDVSGNLVGLTEVSAPDEEDNTEETEIVGQNIYDIFKNKEFSAADQTQLLDYIKANMGLYESQKIMKFLEQNGVTSEQFINALMEGNENPAEILEFLFKSSAYVEAFAEFLAQTPGGIDQIEQLLELGGYTEAEIDNIMSELDGFIQPDGSLNETALNILKDKIRNGDYSNKETQILQMIQDFDANTKDALMGYLGKQVCKEVQYITLVTSEGEQVLVISENDLETLLYGGAINLETAQGEITVTPQLDDSTRVETFTLVHSITFYQYGGLKNELIGQKVVTESKTYRNLTESELNRVYRDGISGPEIVGIDFPLEGHSLDFENAILVSTTSQTQIFQKIGEELVITEDLSVTESGTDWTQAYQTEEGDWLVKESKTITVNVTNYTYDKNGKLTGATGFSKTTTMTRFDSRGQDLTFTDAFGNEVSNGDWFVSSITVRETIYAIVNGQAMKIKEIENTVNYDVSTVYTSPNAVIQGEGEDQYGVEGVISGYSLDISTTVIYKETQYFYDGTNLIGAISNTHTATFTSEETILASSPEFNELSAFNEFIEEASLGELVSRSYGDEGTVTKMTVINGKLVVTEIIQQNITLGEVHKEDEEGNAERDDSSITGSIQINTYDSYGNLTGATGQSYTLRFQDNNEDGIYNDGDELTEQTEGLDVGFGFGSQDINWDDLNSRVDYRIIDGEAKIVYSNEFLIRLNIDEGYFDGETLSSESVVIKDNHGNEYQLTLEEANWLASGSEEDMRKLFDSLNERYGFEPPLSLDNNDFLVIDFGNGFILRTSDLPTDQEMQDAATNIPEGISEFMLMVLNQMQRAGLLDEENLVFGVDMVYEYDRYNQYDEADLFINSNMNTSGQRVVVPWSVIAAFFDLHFAEHHLLFHLLLPRHRLVVSTVVQNHEFLLLLLIYYLLSMLKLGQQSQQNFYHLHLFLQTLLIRLEQHPAFVLNLKHLQHDSLFVLLLLDLHLILESFEPFFEDRFQHSFLMRLYILHYYYFVSMFS
ncbi:hypothetical protein BVX93_00410, partial [bacterium B13(2017)]